MINYLFTGEITVCATMQIDRSLAFFEKVISACLDWLMTAIEDHLSRTSRSERASRGEVVCQ